MFSITKLGFVSCRDKIKIGSLLKTQPAFFAIPITFVWIKRNFHSIDFTFKYVDAV